MRRTKMAAWILTAAVFSAAHSASANDGGVTRAVVQNAARDGVQIRRVARHPMVPQVPTAVRQGHAVPAIPAGMSAAPSSTGGTSAYYGGMIPNTGAALYPAPVPGVPIQMGGTAIGNPALHPHEFMYAHEYKAMYPPYYYKVRGGWIVTPFGVWSQENWKLQGTQIDVKYKSSVSPFSLFRP